MECTITSTLTTSNSVLGHVSCPTIHMIAQIFVHLFEEKKQGSRGYKTALADYYCSSLIDIRNNQSLMRLLMRFLRERPASLSRVLPLDLGLVLDAFKKALIEPLKDIDLFKVSYFQNSVLNGLQQVAGGTVKLMLWTFPQRLAFQLKTKKTTKSSVSEVTIPSLKGYLGPDLADTPEKLYVQSGL